ncbi:MAG: RNA 2',3'-cyclic phosphodiesterase [Candidatus Jorgensenbacteria bacterium]
MTKIRLFVAVLIPEDIRDSIAELVSGLQKVRGLPQDIRFVPPENWHFTLTFLGYQDESVAPQISRLLKFDLDSDIEFEKVIYGPPGPGPRMIWLTTKRRTSEELGKIKKRLEDEFETGGIRWHRELRPYRAHLTLARFPETSPKNLPLIEKEIDWRYKAQEIHLMRSTLKRTGAEYEVLDL